MPEFPQIIRFVVSAIMAIVALLPFWHHFDVAPRWRFSIGVLVGLIAFLVWPSSIQACRYTGLYALGTIAASLWFIFAVVGHAHITRYYQYSVFHPSGTGPAIEKIIGGPELTPQALHMQAYNPYLTKQQIFESLGYDIDKMWIRGPRTRLDLTYRFFALSGVFALLLSLVAVSAYGYIRYKASIAHQPLMLFPSEDQPVVPGRSITIEAKYHECRRGILWDIEGLASDKASGRLGEISQTGTYSPPDTVSRELHFYVVATPRTHPEERQKVKIKLRSHPVYSDEHELAGIDSAGKHAQFIVEVLERDYSWQIGENRLAGADGAALVRRMAADGIFSGFTDIITIGAASRELTTKGEGEEQRRAKDRAQILARWVADALPSSQLRIHSLKVGRYDDEFRLPSELTAQERQVVIVGIERADPNVNLLQALRDAFERKRDDEPLLGMYLDNYPRENWDLSAFRQ
ncbi:MAG TPA: hypothetical protein VF006_28225 [Longimicrobium sp.]